MREAEKVREGRNREAERGVEREAERVREAEGERRERGREGESEPTLIV